MRETITPWAKLIEALGATMQDSDWASDLVQKCKQIEDAVEQIRRIAASRAGGER